MKKLVRLQLSSKKEIPPGKSRLLYNRKGCRLLLGGDWLRKEPIVKQLLKRKKD